MEPEEHRACRDGRAACGTTDLLALALTRARWPGFALVLSRAGEAAGGIWTAAWVVPARAAIAMFRKDTACFNLGGRFSGLPRASRQLFHPPIEARYETDVTHRAGTHNDFA
jgi:hypothetical protein